MNLQPWRPPNLTGPTLQPQQPISQAIYDGGFGMPVYAPVGIQSFLPQQSLMPGFLGQSGVPAAPQAPILPVGRIDEQSQHYLAVSNELIGDQYQVIDRIGHGTFGQVYRALDTKSNALVALKIVRRDERYEAAAIKEREVLIDVQCHYDILIAHSSATQHQVTQTPLQPEYQMLSANSSASYNILVDIMSLSTLRDGHVARLLHSFPYRGHICIVMPLYGPSLSSLISLNQGALPIEWARSMLQSLCRGISEIHASGYVHTDLKPDNVLLRGTDLNCEPAGPGSAQTLHLPVSPRLVVVDLGSAVRAMDDNSHIICTRQYRPPEVILGLRWGRSADIWSLGCIAFEVVTGRMLFHTHDSWEHLALIERIVGPPPAELVETMYYNRKQNHYFVRDASSATGFTVAWPPQTVQPSYHVERRQGDENVVYQTQNLAAQLTRFAGQPYILRFIQRCLQWLPERRPTIDQVLSDAFFTYRAQEVSTQECQTVATMPVPAVPMHLTPSFSIVSSVTRVGRPGGIPLRYICDTIAGYLSAVANVLGMNVMRQQVAEILRLSSLEDRYVRLVAASGLARAMWLVPENAMKLRSANAISDARR